MFKIILMSAIVGYCKASYGGDGGYGGGHGNSITAARKTKYSVDVKHVNIPSEPIKPQTVFVNYDAIPLTIVFRTTSSNIKVLQQHQGSPGQTQESHSEDEPDKLKYTVIKPIFQDVREIITPYRRYRQQIEPVREDIKSIFARGEDRGKGGFSDGSNDIGYSGGKDSGNDGGSGGGYSSVYSSGHGGDGGGYLGEDSED